jgi:hypothetical protein
VSGLSALMSFTLGGKTYREASRGSRVLRPGPIPAAAAPASARAGDKLTVTGTTLTGQPDSGGQVFVYNVDNSNTFSGGSLFKNGTATFSVPAGHYWAVAIFISAVGSADQQRVVILPQFTVSGTTAEHMAEQSASSEVAVATPRPAQAETSTFEIRRPSPAGPVQYWGFNDAGLSLWVSPTTIKPTVGTLQTFTDQQLVSPPGAAGLPYEYDLAYQGPGGIVPPQHYVARAAGLATVDARYYQDVTSSGGETRVGLFGPQLNDVLLFAIDPFALPRHQTEYMTGNPAVFWSDSISQCYPSTPCPGGQNDLMRTFRAGQRLTENWNAYPLHPGPNVNLLGRANPRPVLASASRAGNMLTLDVTPFSDNQPGHTGAGFSTGRYQVDANGVRVAAGNAAKVADGAPNLELHVKLKPGPALIRFALTVARSGKTYPLSARSQTVWTWRSAAGSGAALPPGWLCGPGTASGPASSRCTVQPMMTLDYAVAGLALDGSAPAGGQVVTITAGQLQLAHPAPVTGLRAWVSVNGGQSWQAATVTRHGAGRYAAAFAAAAGTRVSLRVRATDAAGGSITETIPAAYQVQA